MKEGHEVFLGENFTLFLGFSNDWSQSQVILFTLKETILTTPMPAIHHPGTG